MKIFYGRASTTKQEMSCNIQLNEVENRFGTMDISYCDEGISGASPVEKRTELLKMLDEIKKGDEVYIYSLSRIARDTLQNLWIEREIVKAGAKIYSVKEDFEQTPEAVMMRTILSAFATYEREMIKARTAAAKRTYRSQFKYCGGKREYGFEVVDGKMVENKEEQQVIGKIKEWKSAGDKIVDIQRKLNDAGIPSATGKEWSYERLRILVKRVA